MVRIANIANNVDKFLWHDDASNL